MKGQAAMEFLLTYGWAIMIVLLMISGLAYFGVFDIAKFIPDKCVFTAGIACREHVVYHDNPPGTGEKISIILVNNLGDTINPRGIINVTNINGNSDCGCPSGLCGLEGTWHSSEIRTLNLSCNNNVETVDLRIRITYKYIRGDYDRVIEGRLQSKVV